AASHAWKQTCRLAVSVESTVLHRAAPTQQSGIMFSTLHRNLSRATVMQLAVELLWLFAAGLIVMRGASELENPARVLFAPALAFALLVLSFNGAFGIYRRIEKVSSSGYLIRLL